jgi:hypothetical protein
MFPNGGRVHLEGREYIVVSTGEDPMPLPWSNIQNPGFGTLITAAGMRTPGPATAARTASAVCQ